MLGALRRNKNNPIITVVLGLVALLMVGFGISINAGPSGANIATVDGDGILESDYNIRYASMYRQRQSRDRTYDRKRAESDRLRENVLYGMVTSKILANDARAKGLAIDDQALRDEILDNELFHTDGKFDKKQYERMLNYMQTSDRNFESQERERILAQLYLTALQGASVSDDEVRTEWEQGQRKVDVEMIRVKKGELTAKVGTVTPEDAKAFKAKEGADEKIKAFYAKNKRARYDVPKKVCARQILVRADKATPPDLLEEAKAKIKKAHEAVKAGEDFSKVAAQFSDDNNAKSGGDLGCFATGQVLPQVEEAAFGLEPGKYSAIIKSNFGFHIIKVTTVQQPIRKKLEEVEDDIALELAKLDRAGELAKKEAERLLGLAKDHENLDALANAVNAEADRAMTYSVENTGPFPAGREVLPRLGSAPEIAKAAWELTKEKPLPSKAYETDDAWVVLRLKDKLEPNEATWELAKKSLTYGQLVEKQNAIFDGLSKSLRDNHDVLIDPFAFVYDETARAERRQRRQQGF